MTARLFLAGFLFCAIPFTLFAQSAQQAGAEMSDRGKAGLRGPVKTLVEEQTFTSPDNQSFVSTTITEYSPEGKILQRRNENQYGPQYVTTYTYAADGRLLKISSGKSDAPPDSAETYLYDEKKRLIGTKSDGHETRFEYDDSGRKTMVETYAATPLTPGVAYATHWEGSDLGFGALPGGSVHTSYNEHDVATGAKFYEAQGKLVGHIERQFDGQGRVISEKQVTDAPELLVPEELSSQLNPEQLKAVGGFIAAGMHERGTSYSYDAQGRIAQMRRSGGVFGEEITATSYNEQGDKTLETTTAAMNPELGRAYGLSDNGVMVPTGSAPPVQAPSTHETKYTYEYDKRGNWTEQTMESRSTSGEPYTTTTTHRRKLTYY
jgi:YD repeat-containing protein